MKKLIMEYKKQIIIGLLVVLGVFVLFSVFRPKGVRMTDADYVDNEVDEEEIDEKEIEDSSLLELAQALYEEATNIYSMSPYCGINYEDIDEERIETINGQKYYISDYTSINKISKKISEVLENNTITISDIIMKDGFVYCKYNAPKKSSTYLETYLTINSYSGKIATFDAVSTYIKPEHSHYCSVDKPLECSNSDKQTETNKFIIINNGKNWKIREFHLYH